MDSPEKKSIVRRFGLMIWAWATLILCFVLVLLVNQMLSEGRVPLDALETDTDAMPETAEHVQTSQESYAPVKSRSSLPRNRVMCWRRNRP